MDAEINTSYLELHKRARDGLEQALHSDEVVHVVIKGDQNQAIIATDRRAFVFKMGLVSGALFNRQLNSWDYLNISGVELKIGMTSQAVVLQVPGVAPVTQTGRMSKGPNSAWEAPNAIMAGKGEDLHAAVAKIRELVSAFHSTTASSTSPSHTDPIDEVRRLAALRDDGLLTSEEFEKKKRDLLGL